MPSTEENHLADILDFNVSKQDKEEEIMAVAFLEKRCLDLKGKRRTSMKEVAMELERIRMLRNPSPNTGWDDVWTSMGSDLDVDLILFPDVHPLLDIES
ncbi:hypothetical protein ACJRO7_002059 [Eucalyptus globulus]|uniref:Uncharacterized protein n=1 Tax=Eucalyptus globulus TaxID=34317 RepID=A0ABD3LYL0_EUCGL